MAKTNQHASIAAESMTESEQETIKRTVFKPHGCSKCGKGFTSKVTLKRHLHLHSKEQLCQYCKKVFFSEIKLSAHTNRHHMPLSQKEKVFVCKVCDKEFNCSSSLKVHTRIHTGERPYACSFCEKTFQYGTSCKEHERVHTGEAPFACSLCKKTFLYYSSCKEHERNHTEERPFACSFCKKTFQYSSSCKQHERNHIGKKAHACSFCQKTFLKNSDRVEHERIHTGKRLFACSFCPKKFQCSATCKRHEYEHTRPYPCSFCKKTFQHANSRKRHERIIHTGERPYTCLVCQKTFRTFSDRKKHEHVHIGQRPYACSFCKKTFQYNTTRMHHERMHADKCPYVCETCGEGFDSLSNLQHHVSTHTKETPYKCGSGFTQSEAIQHHITEMHNTKSDYECEECGKSYARKGNLHFHIRKCHWYNKCSQCGTSFEDQVKFQEHVKDCKVIPVKTLSPRHYPYNSPRLCSAAKRQCEAPQNTSPKKRPALPSRKHLSPAEAHSSRVSCKKRHRRSPTNVNSTDLLSDCDQFDDDPLSDTDSDMFEDQDECDGDSITAEGDVQVDTEEIIEHEASQLEYKTARNIAICNKFGRSKVNFLTKNKDKGNPLLPVDVATLIRKEGNPDSAFDQNLKGSKELLIQTETSNEAQNSTMDSLVNAFVSTARLHGVVLHMSIATDEREVNFGNKKQGNMENGNPLLSVDVAKIVQMVSEENKLQSRKAAHPIKVGTTNLAVGETANCQSEKSKYSEELLIQTDDPSSNQPQSDNRDSTMDSLVKALVSAAKQQGVVLHVHCLK